MDVVRGVVKDLKGISENLLANQLFSVGAVLNGIQKAANQHGLTQNSKPVRPSIRCCNCYPNRLVMVVAAATGRAIPRTIWRRDPDGRSAHNDGRCMA